VGKKAKSLIRMTSITGKDDVVFKSPIEYARFVSCSITLPAYDGVYYVVGYMFNPTNDTDIFKMNVVPQTTKKGEVTVYPIERDFSYKITDELKGSRAGGCPNFESWVNNPQYGIESMFGEAHISTLLVPGTASLPLSKIKPQSLACAVFLDKDRAGKITNWGQLCSEQPSYAGSQQLVTKTKIEDGAYYIMPHSFKPEYQFPFELYIYSSTPLKMTGVGKKGKEIFLNLKSKARADALDKLVSYAQSLKSKHKTARDMESYLKKFFKEFDTSGGRGRGGDGYFSEKEFEKAMRSLTGGTLDDHTVDILFDMMDVEGTDMLSSEEFSDAVVNCAY